MKKKIMIRKTIYTLLLAFSLTLGSCDDFLERSAQNLVIPTTCADYTEILQGEGYFYSLINDGTWLNLMTDDMELFTPNKTIHCHSTLSNIVMYISGATKSKMKMNPSKMNFSITFILKYW